LGKKLSLTTLFQAPTIEQLADFLRREGPASPWSSLIPLQAKGSKPPFFWVHGDSSNAFLPRYLDPDQPLYGFMHQGWDGQPARYRSVQEIATHYLEEMRTVQPRGPYFLGGYCFGGMVAFDMAQQLKRQGEEVALLFLIDSRFPSDELPDSDDLLRSGSFRDEAHRHFRNLALLGRREKFTYVRVRVTGIMKGKIDGMRATISKMLGKIICNGYLAMGHPVPFSLRSSYILGIYSQARQNYVPQPYPGRATYVKSEKRSNTHLLEWNKLFVEGMDLYELPGDHLDMTKEPNVSVWAEHLKSCLRNAHTAKSAARDSEMPERFNATREL
jgi:thioesterase domain-containing protein